MKTVSCNWVLRLKYKPDKTIGRYKAMLAENGVSSNSWNRLYRNLQSYVEGFNSKNSTKSVNDESLGCKAN